MIEPEHIAKAVRTLNRKDRIRIALKALGIKQNDAAHAIGHKPLYLRNALALPGEPPILDKIEQWIIEQIGNE